MIVFSLNFDCAIKMWKLRQASQEQQVALGEQIRKLDAHARAEDQRFGLDDLIRLS